MSAPCPPVAAAPSVGNVDAGRWELLRALGACTVLAPPASDGISDTLGLPRWDRSGHTRLFVMDLPPYASIHLGPEGGLGGEGAERVAGVWRALALDPPADADHLALLLALYAHLGHASETCRTEAARARLEHTRTVVLFEHLWSWVPGYLAAAEADPAGEAWTHLLTDALEREIARTAAPAVLPAALREAPAPPGTDVDMGRLLDALIAPVRSGFVLTWADLRSASGETGVGLRRGERRFALRAMLEQDAAATLAWLAGHARRWATVHRVGLLGAADPGAWWRQRSLATAATLDALTVQAGRAR